MEDLKTPAFEDPGEYVPPVSEKRGPGRPRKIPRVDESQPDQPKAKPKKVRVKLSKEELKDIHDKSVESVSHAFTLATAFAAKLAKTPEIALDANDSQALAGALVSCLEAWFPESHGLILGPRLMTSLQLGGTVGVIAVKKRAAIRMRNAKDITPAKPEDPKQPPAPEVNR